MFKQILPVDLRPRERLEQRMHEGYEWLYVISGRLRLALGEDALILERGEAAEFDTRAPHGYGNGGSEPVELLIIYGPQSEQVHLRARTIVKQRAQVHH